MHGEPLLRVDSAVVRHPVHGGLLTRPRELAAVDGVSLEIRRGEMVGLVGESGCGKSSLGRALLRLTPLASGEIHLEGRRVDTLPESAWRPLRKRIQMVFQDPSSSLNPRLTVGESVGEALEVHRLGGEADGRRRRVAELLRDVGLDAADLDRRPSEFSGGQRQRIGIARALASEPDLLVCDEPVSALDVSVQAQVVNLLAGLHRQRGLAALFISHDLAVVGHLCSRILVMYLGRLVEQGPTVEILSRPAHPYTAALLAAIPGNRTGVPSATIRGEPPSPLAPPSGCRFHPRCPAATARCRSESPAWTDVGTGWKAACHHPTLPARS